MVISQGFFLGGSLVLPAVSASQQFGSIDRGCVVTRVRATLLRRRLLADFILGPDVNQCLYLDQIEAKEYLTNDLKTLASCFEQCGK